MASPSGLSFDEIFAIAADPEKSQNYPSCAPHSHNGQRGRLWTFPTKEAESVVSLEGLTKIPGIAENQYWQPLGELSALAKRATNRISQSV